MDSMNEGCNSTSCEYEIQVQLAQWVEEQYEDGVKYTYLARSNIYEDYSLESQLANASFHHRATFAGDDKDAGNAMRDTRQYDTSQTFSGIRLDTCENRSSLISQSQYMSYSTEFVLRPAIRGIVDLEVKGIYVAIKAICTLKMQSQFKNLNQVVDVDFLV